MFPLSEIGADLQGAVGRTNRGTATRTTVSRPLGLADDEPAHARPDLQVQMIAVRVVVVGRQDALK